MKLSFRNKRAGFSILEVVISLFVLSIGFLGVSNLVVTTLRNDFLSRDAVIASLLVQEGAELVYNIRDTNVAKNGEDRAFDGIGSGSYRIDAFDTNPSLSGCSQYESCRLSLVEEKYRMHGGNKTRFSRKILVSEDPDVRHVTSVVAWDPERGFPETIGAATCNLATRCSFVQLDLQKIN